MHGTMSLKKIKYIASLLSCPERVGTEFYEGELYLEGK